MKTILGYLTVIVVLTSGSLSHAAPTRCSRMFDACMAGLAGLTLLSTVSCSDGPAEGETPWKPGQVITREGVNLEQQTLGSTCVANRNDFSDIPHDKVRWKTVDVFCGGGLTLQILGARRGLYNERYETGAEATMVARLMTEMASHGYEAQLPNAQFEGQGDVLRKSQWISFKKER